MQIRMRNKQTHSPKSLMGRFWLAMILADTPALSADNAAKKTYREYPEWGMMPDAVGFEDEKGARPECRVLVQEDCRIQKKQKSERIHMFKKANNPLSLVLAAFMLLFLASPLAKAQGEMTVAEVLSLLPQSPDMDDNLEVANYDKLVAQGQAIYGVLLEIVRTHPDTRVASCALSVLCDAQGDKREVVAELGKVLEEKQFLTDSQNEFMLMVLAKAISDMGEENDKQLLQPLFSHPSEGVREVAVYFTDRLEKKAANLATPPAEVSDTISSGGNRSEEAPPRPVAGP